jgi:Rieske 2Fe-2S family protein
MKPFLNSTEIGSLGQSTFAATQFLSEGIFAEEFETIFSRSWICAARSDELSTPGQFRLRQLGSESLILVRDQDNQIRGHFNLCRHRGTRLCNSETGHLHRTIQCPYHAWTYALDGSLVGVPDEREFENFDRNQYPLHSFACDEWNGFVWINIAPMPIPFKQAFHPIFHKFDPWQLNSLQSARQIDYQVKANWKLIVQNYSECYHCSPVHPSLVKLSPASSGGNDLIEGPFLGGYMSLNNPGGSMSNSGQSCGVTVGPLHRDDLTRVYYYVLFPNTFFSLHHDYAMVHTLWPISPAETRVECTWLFHPETLSTSAFDPSDAVDFWDRTNKEDWHVSEQTQLGLTSSRYRPGPYGGRESMSAAFDRYYLSVMDHASRARCE